MACNQVIDSNGTENRDGFFTLDAVDEYTGQAFTMGGTARDICKSQFYLNLHDLDAGEYYTINSRVYACTGTVGSTGVPTGEPLATSDNVTITYGDTGWDAWVLYDFIFSTPYTLNASTDYCILVYGIVDGTNSDDDDLEVGVDLDTNSHSGNSFNQDAPYNQHDCIFYMHYESGWTGTILGVTNPARINGILVADIAKVNGL